MSEQILTVMSADSHIKPKQRKDKNETVRRTEEI